MSKKIVYGKFSTILNEEGKEIFRCTDYGTRWTGPNSIENFQMLESVEKPEAKRFARRLRHKDITRRSD
jgi:hypothetical protein